MTSNLDYFAKGTALPIASCIGIFALLREQIDGIGHVIGGKKFEHEYDFKHHRLDNAIAKASLFKS